MKKKIVAMAGIAGLAAALSTPALAQARNSARPN